MSDDDIDPDFEREVEGVFLRDLSSDALNRAVNLALSEWSDEKRADFGRRIPEVWSCPGLVDTGL